MKPVTLTVNSWDGDIPLPGEYVKSARGKSAFMVLEVRRSRPGSKSFGRFICERHQVSAIPRGTRVHEWVWASR